MALDLFGPTAAAGGVVTRPGETRSFSSADTFFRDCSSPELDDGTELVSAWFNQVLANLRGVARGNGQTVGSVDIVTQDNADDALVLKAIQHLIQRGQPSYAVDTGSANQVIIALSPAPPEVKAGMVVRFKKMNADCTGPMTIIPNGLGPYALKLGNGADPASGDIKANMPYEAIFDSGLNAWVVVNYNGAAAAAAVSPLKVLELSVSGAPQSLTPTVYTKVTCLSNVIRNTLSTSTWDGSNFTVGAGEAGLWHVQYQLGIGNRYSCAIYLQASRVRAGVTKSFIIGYMTYPGSNFTSLAECMAQCSGAIDLQVGDVVSFFASIQGPAGSYSISAGPPPGTSTQVPGVSLQRIEGLY